VKDKVFGHTGRGKLPFIRMDLARIVPVTQSAKDVIVETDSIRARVSTRLDRAHRAQLGQFLTPSSVARYMASLFRQDAGGECRLLDAGAGIGSLSAAFLERWADGGFSFKRVAVDAFEIDEGLCPELARPLEEHERRLAVRPNTVRPENCWGGSR